MKNTRLRFFAVVGLFTLPAWLLPAAEPVSLASRVVGVSDGDTITVPHAPSQLRTQKQKAPPGVDGAKAFKPSAYSLIVLRTHGKDTTTAIPMQAGLSHFFS